MRIFLSILLLLFSLQSWTKANDISEFQIEGMSIGDSLLNYFNEEYILEEFEIGKNEYNWTDQKFADVYKYGEVELYDNVNFSVKRKDKKYIIYAITGQITYNNINDCLYKQKEIENDFSTLLGDKNPQDMTGKSKIHRIVFEFKSMDKIEIVCFDLAKHMNQPSGLDVGIVSAEYRKWLNSF